LQNNAHGLLPFDSAYQSPGITSHHRDALVRQQEVIDAPAYAGFHRLQPRVIG
jgi:hypothetical protein